VRFLSVEPQLEHISLVEFGHQDDWHCNALDPPDSSCRINWVINGGESGPHARPFDIAWARDIRDQCEEAGVPYFFKQGGSRFVGKPCDECDGTGTDTYAVVPGGAPPECAACRGVGSVRIVTKDKHAADPSEWPEDLRVQEFPR
jgi:protein gp37